MARYSDINRADELKAAADKLETWRRLSRPAKKTAYNTQLTALQSKRANVGRQPCYIQPFISSNKVWLETKCLASPDSAPTAGEETETGLITALSTAIGISATGRCRTVPPTGANLVIFPGRRIKFARAIITEKKGVVIQATSRITGLPYSYRGGSSVSCPFGRTGSETEDAARAAIRNAIPPTADRTVRFVTQGSVKITEIGATA